LDKKKIIKLNQISFFLIIISCITYYFVVKATTFNFHDGLHEQFLYTKGYKLAEGVNQANRSDEDLFKEYSSGDLTDKDATWDKDSITLNENLQSAIFILFTLFLSISISFWYQLFKERKKKEKGKDLSFRNKVFISYNHADIEIAFALKKKLENNNISVTIDGVNMEGGGDIKSFIDHSISNTDITISIISNKSLLSSWVGIETVNTFNHEQFSAKKKFIPCYIEKDFLENTFTGKAIDQIDERIKKIGELVITEIEKGRDPRDLNAERARLIKLRNSMDEIILRLRESLCIDISGNQLEINFQKILNAVNSQ
jgi:hypothetical protein